MIWIAALREVFCI